MQCKSAAALLMTSPPLHCCPSLIMLVSCMYCVESQASCHMQAASVSPRDPIPRRSRAALDSLNTDPDGLPSTEAELLDVCAVSCILGIVEQLQDWLENGLQGSPPEIVLGELDNQDLMALCPEHLPVLDICTA